VVLYSILIKYWVLVLLYIIYSADILPMIIVYLLTPIATEVANINKKLQVLVLKQLPTLYTKSFNKIYFPNKLGSSTLSTMQPVF